jgi:Domain of unknown function (DUF4340)
MARKTTVTPKKSAPRKASSSRQEVSKPTHRKPVFSAGTLITVLVLAILVFFALYLKHDKEVKAAEATPTGGATSFVFTAEDGNVSSIEIKPTQGESVKIVHNAEKAWALELPAKTEANQSMAEAAATQIKALEIVAPLDDDPSIFGFDTPSYLITIEFEGGKKHTLEIGDNTPTGSGYYVRLDKGKMMIVSLSSIESLLNLVNFPPYLNTPTPTPTALPPTETPAPPTEAISTLETTVTPTP